MRLVHDALDALEALDARVAHDAHVASRMSEQATGYVEAHSRDAHAR